MSSSEELPTTDLAVSGQDDSHGLSRRSLLTLGAAGLASLTLSACGFHPMYGNPQATGGAGGATGAKLAEVEIEPIADRIGQQLHNRLRDRMNPAGQPDKPNYRLQVTLDQSDAVVSNGNGNIRHNTLTVTATYWLSPADNDKSYLMDRINSRVNVSYDTLDDPYNDIATRDDAQLRAIDQLADMITTRVAAYFGKNTA
ncbi:MAG TPA: LPS assembly lipoprotein LptE [Terriglobales bacterium]|nr:LPS assembly lipoprotein LptE [Terriglobales bacterium]